MDFLKKGLKRDSRVIKFAFPTSTPDINFISLCELFWRIVLVGLLANFIIFIVRIIINIIVFPFGYHISPSGTKRFLSPYKYWPIMNKRWRVLPALGGYLGIWFLILLIPFLMPEIFASKILLSVLVMLSYGFPFVFALFRGLYLLEKKKKASNAIDALTKVISIIMYMVFIPILVVILSFIHLMFLLTGYKLGEEGLIPIKHWPIKHERYRVVIPIVV